MTQCFLRQTRAIGHRQWLTTETPLRFIPLTNHRPAHPPASGEPASLSPHLGGAGSSSRVKVSYVETTWPSPEEFR